MKQRNGVCVRLAKYIDRRWSVVEGGCPVGVAVLRVEGAG